MIDAHHHLWDATAGPGGPHVGVGRPGGAGAAVDPAVGWPKVPRYLLADALADMMTALERRLARAAMVECRKHAGLIAARLVADTQIRALRAVSEKLGVRFREPGKPRLYLHLYDRQEELGEIYMNLEDADWHRVQAVIQRNFSRAADIGYYASANLDEEELRVLQRQTKTRRGVTQVFKPPLHLSPAHSKPARLVRVYNKRTFLSIFNFNFILEIKFINFF